MSWQKEKRRKLSLDLNARRKEYWCRDRYVRLEDVPTWRQYWASLQQQQQTSVATDDVTTRRLVSGLCLKKSVELADKISIFRGDITQLEIDAVVNAANHSLLGGGGVDGAIHRGAGPCLRKENQTLNGCKDGEAKISGGYNLPAKYVISTVGPRGEQPAVLRACYNNSLSVMLANKLRSVAFPCIATGIYGYPNDAAAEVALKTVRTFLEEHHQAVDRIVFCLFLPVDVALYERMMPHVFPVELAAAAPSTPSAADVAVATASPAAEGTVAIATTSSAAEDTVAVATASPAAEDTVAIATASPAAEDTVASPTEAEPAAAAATSGDTAKKSLAANENIAAGDDVTAATNRKAADIPEARGDGGDSPSSPPPPANEMADEMSFDSDEKSGAEDAAAAVSPGEDSPKH